MTYIERVTFKLADDEDISKTSTIIVTRPEVTENTSRPPDGSVYSLQMGTSEYDATCDTCGHQKLECTGHPGMIDSRISIMQPIVMKEIRWFLRAVCHNCGAPTITMKKKGLKKVPQPINIKKDEEKFCSNCGVELYRVLQKHVDEPVFIMVQTTKDKKDIRILYPDDIKKIFEMITDETMRILQKNVNVHPRKYIISKIRVIPVSARPCVKALGTSGSTSYHDITNIIQTMVKSNNYIPHDVDLHSTADEVRKVARTLQKALYDLIIGTPIAQGSSSVMKKGAMVNSHFIKSIFQRIQSKEGRIRINLIGKRAWWMARSVISGDVSYKADEVSIPLSVARTLQIQEVFQEYNFDKLMIYFRNGRNQYPGCTRIKRKNGGLYLIDMVK
jgi:DNA-directed RNA polymerase II subunit RPB1